MGAEVRREILPMLVRGQPRKQDTAIVFVIVYSRENRPAITNIYIAALSIHATRFIARASI